MHFSRHLLDKLSIAKKALYIPEGQAPPDHHTHATRTPHARHTHAITDRGVSLLKTEVVYITSVDKSQYNFEF